MTEQEFLDAVKARRRGLDVMVVAPSVMRKLEENLPTLNVPSWIVEQRPMPKE